MNSPLETAVEIAREAGALLVTYYERRVPFELKGEFDLVTEADRASEKLIVERLQSRFPAARHRGGRRRRAHQPFGIPLVRGPAGRHHQLRPCFPMFSVTLGLERAGEMMAGVVFDPDPAGDVHRRARRRRVPEQPPHPRFGRQPARRQPGFHRLSQPQAPSQREHPFLLPVGDGHRTACAAPVRRRSIWPTWPAAGWISSGNSA